MRKRGWTFPAAKEAAGEVLAITVKLHGPKHWRVTDARWKLADVKRYATVGPEQRRQLAEATQLNHQVVGLRRLSENSICALKPGEIGEVYGRKTLAIPPILSIQMLFLDSLLVLSGKDSIKRANLRARWRHVVSDSR